MKGGYMMNKPTNFDEKKYNEFVNLYKERTSFIRYAKDLGISINDTVHITAWLVAKATSQHMIRFLLMKL